jgi:Icc-related predicted phosphoesterase
MRLVCTSDTHGQLERVRLPEGDILVLAGDVLKNFYMGAPRKDASRQLRALEDLLAFLDKTKFKWVVLIAGNHDWAFQYEPDKARALVAQHTKVVYLEDSGATIDGIRFYGSPWQPAFCGWAFNLPRNGAELAKVWAKVPEDVDVLVTHGPPFRVLDSSPGVCREQGDAILLERVCAVKPRHHVFGHIHGGYGRKRVGETEFLNVAMCDEGYEPVQPPQVIELEPRE